MAPFVAAASSAETDTTSASSSYADAPASPSPPSSARRAAPTLLLLASLAALLILSSGDDAAAQPLRDVSLKNPEVTFAPSSMDGQFCERIRLSGIPRLHLASYPSQIHVRMNVSQSIPEKFHWKIEVCFHGNASMGLCQCDTGEWRAFQTSMWNAVKSPYGNKYIDVKLADKKSTSFTLSVQEEFQRWRLACLGIGFVLLFLSPIVSKWAPFYYSSSMALGILLVVLIVLFQGMKLLPMGKKSLFYLTIYGSVLFFSYPYVQLGVGSYVVHYFSTLVATILENFGLSEEMHNPVSIFLLIAIVLTGAGFGDWMVRRFILSKDGSVDAGIAQFVNWAMRVVATFFVTQSTLDPLLALVALAACWVLSMPVLVQETKAAKGFFSAKVYTRITQKSPGLGSTLARWVVPNQDEDYYSTFNNIQPGIYSKKEWKEFTQESTRKALAECTATPEFAKWVADNAHRVQVEKDDDVSDDEIIESSSNSAEETEDEAGKAPGLYWWSREQD